MLKQLLTVTCCMFSMSLIAQSPLQSNNIKFEHQPLPYQKVAVTGFEPVTDVHTNPNLPLIQRTDVEYTVGQTFYDLQSNNATPKRLASHTDGTRYATWTFGLQATAYPDRGTGLNIYNPGTGTWGAYPSARIEDVRCGWANIDVLANGSPIIISHRAGPERPYVSRWVNNAWVHAAIPTAVPPGVIWPRMAVGGPDGNTVHALGLSYPPANGGAPYEGVNGHILYYRSLNGGETWDKLDVILPEINKDYYASMSADTYSIDAHGNTVVVAQFGSWGDVKLSKSVDNGETWTTWTIHDFPLDKYVIDQGYTVDEIPVDPNAPNELAIRTSDETGAVLIDKNGMAHAWFGQMYVIDAELTDGGTQYYPATMGLRYWNETYGEDSTRLIIPGIIDANGNDTLDIASINVIPLYFASLTSHPTVGMDASGNIFMAYSGLTENFTSSISTPNAGQHCRHIYLTYSGDNGQTWSNPIDLITEDLVLEPDLISLYETMFPSMDKRVDSKVHLIYQADFEPGLAVRGDMDIAALNYINYLAVDVAELGVVGTEVVKPAEFSFEISPNPASSMVKITYELPQAASTRIDVYDMTGQKVKNLSTGVQAAGSHNALLNVGNLAKGIYLVRLQSGDKIATQKVFVN